MLVLKQAFSRGDSLAVKGIYYGAADTVTGMAFTTVDELLSYMRKYPHPVD